MLRTACLAICDKIPEELNISSEILKHVRLVAPQNTGKPLGAIVKIESDKAMNTNP